MLHVISSIYVTDITCYIFFILIQGADNQKYDEVPSITRLLNVIEEYLGDYNAQVNAGRGTGLGTRGGATFGMRTYHLTCLARMYPASNEQIA
jgi:hypothetical protein